MCSAKTDCSPSNTVMKKASPFSARERLAINMKPTMPVAPRRRLRPDWLGE